MSRRRWCLSVVLVTLSVTASSGAVAHAAADGRPCGNNYTNGQPYQLRTSPKPSRGAGRQAETAVRVKKGAEVQLAARLLLAQVNAPAKPCPGRRIGFYTRNAGSSQYALLRNPTNVTNYEGLMFASKIASRDFRFFANFNLNATTVGARTGTTLVQTRP